MKTTNITLKMLLSAAIMASMASGMQAMKETIEVSRHEDAGLSKTGLKTVQSIITIIKDKNLESEEKIEQIKKIMLFGLESVLFYESCLEKPILWHAIESGDLELVKFLVEECGCNVNAQFANPYVNNLNTNTVYIVHDIHNFSFDHTGKAIDKKTPTTISLLEFAAELHAKNRLTNPDKAFENIYLYLLNLPDMVISDKVAHAIASIAYSKEAIKTIFNKKPHYKMEHLILNYVNPDILALSGLGSSEEWVKAAHNLITSNLSGIKSQVTDILTVAMDRAKKDGQKLSDTLLMQTIRAIQAHTKFTPKERADLLNHAIFGEVKKTFPLTKEHCELALKIAQGNNNFDLARMLFTQPCEKSKLPMKEILEIGNFAIEKNKNNCFVDIVNNFPLSQQDEKKLLSKTMRLSKPLELYVFTHKLPQQVTKIVNSRNTVALKNTTDLEEHYNSLEELLQSKIGLCGDNKHLRLEFLKVVSSQLWNLCPAGQHKDGSSSKNTNIIGADNARHILEYIEYEPKVIGFYLT